MNSCVVVIPIYKEYFTADELFSVASSLPKLSGYDIYFVAPKSLNLNFYKNNFRVSGFKLFPDIFFKNIEGYNKLLVSPRFYEEFLDFDYILICQPDAIVLRPDLSLWLDKGYDYIGAPWPQGFSLNVKTSSLPLVSEIKCTAFVGNGGFSLRRNSACLKLLNDFPDLSKHWYDAGHAEDLFFSLVSGLSENFKTPNLMTAAMFSHDIDPLFLQKLILNKLPFGVHAWAKYERKYWLSKFCQINLNKEEL